MTKGYLSEQPFRDFLETMYFKRYLQWKWLERLVNTDNFNVILNVCYTFLFVELLKMLELIFSNFFINSLLCFTTYHVI